MSRKHKGMQTERDAYAMKKSASRAPEMPTLVADAGNNYAKI